MNIFARRDVRIVLYVAELLNLATKTQQRTAQTAQRVWEYERFVHFMRPSIVPYVQHMRWPSQCG